MCRVMKIPGVREVFGKSRQYCLERRRHFVGEVTLAHAFALCSYPLYIGPKASI